MWRLQGSGAIFVCWVSVKLRLLFTAGPYWQVVSARCAVWIFIDLWNLRPQNACSLSFLRPALKICVKNADFCVNANPGIVACICVCLCQSWACPRNYSWSVQARIAKFGPKVQNILVKVLIVFWEQLTLTVKVKPNFKSKILPNSELEVCPRDNSLSV